MDDVEAIKQLSARYNLAFDHGDVEGYLATWTEDGYFERTHSDATFRFRGRQELRGILAGYEVDGRHLTGNFIIEVDGDRATQSAYLTYLARGEEGFAITMFGVYADELVRTTEGWRYSARRLRIDD
jgi:3-phenylpropionate/cinnamic acid dioxygenase small subunit